MANAKEMGEEGCFQSKKHLIGQKFIQPSKQESQFPWKRKYFI